MSRSADCNAARTGCSSARRCRKRACDHCGPIRAQDEWRKFHDNLRAYGGRIVLVAVTAPGAEALPWDVGVCGGGHRCSGPSGCRVHERAGRVWNATASRRYGRLWKAAQVSADRLVRRLYAGPMPRRVAVAWSAQERGVWHVHEALPAATEVERAWSRQVVRFIAQAAKRDAALTPNEWEHLLEFELVGANVRGFYGWGFVDRNPLRKAAAIAGGAGHEQAARYLARNAAGYLSENAATEAASIGGRSLRSYVSRRLTMATGVTMRRLRLARHLWVCLTLGLPLPSWADDERELETVWRLLVGAEARGP